LQCPCDPESESLEGLIATLADKYDVADIPGFVAITADGSITRQGGELSELLFSEESRAVSRFPWQPLTLQDVAVGSFDKLDGSKVNMKDIETGTVGFLFSGTEELFTGADEFVKDLAEVYKSVKEAGKTFEIIYVPVHISESTKAVQAAQLDEGETLEQQDYTKFRASMPWLSIGLTDQIRASDLAEACTAPDSEAMATGPQLHLMTRIGTAAKVINPNASQQILREQDVGFPWKRPLVQVLESAIEDDPDILEREPCLLAFLPKKKEAQEPFKAELLKCAQDEEKAGRGGLTFLTSKSESDMGSEFLSLVGIDEEGGLLDVKNPPFGLEDKKQYFKKGESFMLVYAMGANACAYVSDKTGLSVQDFVNSYRKGELKPQAIDSDGNDGEEEDEEDDGEDVDLGSEDTDEE